MQISPQVPIDSNKQHIITFMKDDKTTYKYIVSTRLLLKYPNILQPFRIIKDIQNIHNMRTSILAT